MEQADVLPCELEEVAFLRRIGSVRGIRVAVPTQGLGREYRWATGKQRSVSQSLLSFRGYRAIIVQSAGEDVCEDVEQREKVLGEYVSVEAEPLRGETGGHTRTRTSQLVVQRHASEPLGATEECRGEHLGTGREESAVPREGDVQTELHHGHRGKPYGSHPEPVVEYRL
ncbi:hypothetical protein [Nocardiopsis rhodophaea]|uniref:hypothetical protein n=1 Tax=Nocardiopsis rhodophaea TaxID=280238 RepID=UPI0031CDF8DB